MSQPQAPYTLLTPTTCQQVDKLVGQVAAKTGEEVSTIYDRVYDRMNFLFGVNLPTLPRLEADESLLSVAQRHGLLDKLYAIAYAELLYASDLAE